MAIFLICITMINLVLLIAVVITCRERKRLLELHKEMVTLSCAAHRESQAELRAIRALLAGEGKRPMLVELIK